MKSKGGKTLFPINPSNKSFVRSYLLALVFLISIALGITWLLSFFREDISYLNIKVMMKSMKNKLEFYLSHDPSWSYTSQAKENKLSFQCLKSKSCFQEQSQKHPFFVIKDEEGKTVYSSLKKSQGFNAFLEPCSTFQHDRSLGNNKCPFRYEFFWVPRCFPSKEKCKNSRIEVHGNLLINGQSQFPLKSSEYKIRVLR